MDMLRPLQAVPIWVFCCIAAIADVVSAVVICSQAGILAFLP